MKHPLTHLLLTSCFLSILPNANGAIAWIDPAGGGSTSYNANDTLVLRSDPTNGYGSWGNITMDFQSTLGGSVAFSSSGNISTGQIVFTSAAAILGNGGTATFSFDFHELINSGAKHDRDGSSLGVGDARSAAMFLIDRTDLDVAMQITRIGSGNPDERTLEEHFANGDTPASAGDTGHTVNSLFSFDSLGGRATYESSSGDVAQFSEGNLSSGSNARILLYDHNRSASNGDWNFQFQEMEFQVTNNSATEIAAGTKFIFTFEGVSATPDPVVPIPEPSAAFLLTLGSIATLFRRARRVS